jgi:hypothetical protein
MSEALDANGFLDCMEGGGWKMMLIVVQACEGAE